MSSPRPLTEADRPRAARLLAEAYPHRAHEPRFWVSGHPNEEKRWVVDAETGGECVAYLALWPVNATKFRLDLVVEPHQRNRGLGGELLAWLIDRAKALGATSLQARPDSTEAAALRLLARHDFRETMRMTGLVLDDIGVVNLDPLDVLQHELDRQGLRITTLARELATDRNAWTKLRDTNQAAYVGWPDPDPSPNAEPPKPESPEEFRRRAERFGMINNACFVAAGAEDYVGYSALTAVDPPRGQAGSGGTAVRPAHRGNGVATALKACTIRWAQENGYRSLATSSGNPAMIRVNEKFGFRRTYDEVRLVLNLAASTQSH
jgi:RimJ/RimL family protein N-acetyltransferase